MRGVETTFEPVVMSRYDAGGQRNVRCLCYPTPHRCRSLVVLQARSAGAGPSGSGRASPKAVIAAALETPYLCPCNSLCCSVRVNCATHEWMHTVQGYPAMTVRGRILSGAFLAVFAGAMIAPAITPLVQSLFDGSSSDASFFLGRSPSGGGPVCVSCCRQPLIQPPPHSKALCRHRRRHRLLDQNTG